MGGRTVVLEAEIKQAVSDPIRVEYIDRISIAFSANGVVTPTPANTATALKFSNDGINWVADTSVVPLTSLGTVIAPKILDGVCYKWMQVTMTGFPTNCTVYVRGTAQG